MAFNQSEVEELLVLTGRRCCICGSLHNVSLHHIVPGNDRIDNAIPLCPSCHDQVHASNAPGRTSRGYTPRELQLHKNRTIHLAMGVQVRDRRVVDHFYTVSEPERQRAISDLGYSNEGIAGYVYPSRGQGRLPLYRLWNRDTADHFYTTLEVQRRSAIETYGYIDEDVACYVPHRRRATVRLFRMFSQSTQDHFYTTSVSERDRALGYGYVLEDEVIEVYESTRRGTVPLYKVFRNA